MGEEDYALNLFHDLRIVRVVAFHFVCFSSSGRNLDLSAGDPALLIKIGHFFLQFLDQVRIHSLEPCYNLKIFHYC